MPQSTTKKKASWETGFVVVECPYATAALIAVGLELAENTPIIDNVYSDEMPWRDSGGLFNLASGEIERSPDHVGSVKVYVRPANADGVDTHGVLTYWRDPAPVREEMAAMPDRFRSADSPQSRYSLSEDIRCLLPAAAVAHMREAASTIPVAQWGEYPPVERHRAAYEWLEALPELLTRPEANAPAMLADYEERFPNAMRGAIQQFFRNYLDLRSILGGIVPAVRVRNLSQSRFPLVLPLGPNFQQQRDLWT